MAANNAINEGCSILSCSADGIVRDCYTNVTWSDEFSFCDCVVFPGWTGPNCDEVSPELIHSRVWYVFATVGLICLILLLLHDISRLCYIQYTSRGQTDVHLPVSLFVAAFATLAGYTGNFIYAAILAKSSFDPAATKAFENSTVIKVENATTAFVFLNLTLGAAMIAELQITLTWLNITENLEGFLAFKHGKWKTAVTGYKIFAQVATVSSFFLAIGFAATLNESAIRLTMIVVASIVTGFLIIGRVRFVSMLSSIAIDSSPSNDFRKPMDLVRRTSCYVLVITFICTGAVAVQLIYNQTAEMDISPGDFSYSELIGNISFFFAYCFYAVYQWYIHKLTNTFSARKWKLNDSTTKRPEKETPISSNDKDIKPDELEVGEMTL